MIKAAIDRAVLSVSSEGVRLELVGWCFAHSSSVLIVEVRADGSPLGLIPYGFSRPGVWSQFRDDCKTADVGFCGTLDLPAASLPPEAKVSIAFTLTDLKEVEMPIRVTIGDDAAPMGTSTPVPSSARRSSLPHAAPGALSAPTFFILGAGKCGTTSLYHTLKQHPEIHLSDVKEPSFFSRSFQVVSNPVEYFSLFPFREGKRHYGEASHLYLSAPEAAPVLRQLFPEAKFLLIFRNPTNRAYSLYQHMRRSAAEPLESFEEALAEEDKRYLDRDFQNRKDQYFWNYMYVRSSLYDVQLRHYLDGFRAEQFFALTLGEWQQAPQVWTRRIFEFLGVDPNCKVTYEPQNQADGYPELASTTRAMLDTRFAGVRENVESLIGRRFSQWEY